MCGYSISLTEVVQKGLVVFELLCRGCLVSLPAAVLQREWHFRLAIALPPWVLRCQGGDEEVEAPMHPFALQVYRMETSCKSS